MFYIKSSKTLSSVINKTELNTNSECFIGAGSAFSTVLCKKFCLALMARLSKGRVWSLSGLVDLGAGRGGAVLRRTLCPLTYTLQRADFPDL